MTDPAAERGILAGICRYGISAFSDVSDLVTANSFGIDSNQYLYKCLGHVFKDTEATVVDYPTIMSAANALGISQFFEHQEEQKHLRAVMNMAVQQEGLRRLAVRVRKLEIARVLDKELDAAKEKLAQVTGDESIDNIIGLAEAPATNLGTLLEGGDGPAPIGQGIREYLAHLESNPRECIGISSGFTRWDRALGGGFRPKTVNVIGARPKAGKTTLGYCIGLHVAKHGIPVINLDTEMSLEDNWHRLAANLASVPINVIESGKFGSHKAAINQAVQTLENLPYDYSSIAGKPFEDTLSLLRRWVQRRVGLGPDGKAKPCLVIFDYLKLMSDDSIDKNLAEYQALGFMMTGLHNFAVRWGLPCLAFVQLNRDGISREGTDVVSQSDRIIWLCSNFSIFKKKSPEELAENSQFNRKLVVTDAVRHGPGLDDDDYINMNMLGHFARVTEGPTRKELDASISKNEGKADESVDF